MPEDKHNTPGNSPRHFDVWVRGVQIDSTGQNASQMPRYRTIKHPQEETLVKQLSQFEYENKIILIINTVYKKSITLSPRGDSCG